MDRVVLLYYIYYIILLYPVKVVSSESGEKYAQIKDCLQVKTVKHILLDFEVRRQQMMVFFTGGSVMHYSILAGIDSLKLKHLNDGLVSYKQAAFDFTRC